MRPICIVPSSQPSEVLLGMVCTSSAVPIYVKRNGTPCLTQFLLCVIPQFLDTSILVCRQIRHSLISMSDIPKIVGYPSVNI